MAKSNQSAEAFEDFLKDAVGNCPDDGTAYMMLLSDHGLRWALCATRGDEGIAMRAKIAFQSEKAVMQCDYDVDWLMPYAQSGDVWDTDTEYDEDGVHHVAVYLYGEWVAMLDALVPVRQYELSFREEVVREARAVFTDDATAERFARRAVRMTFRSAPVPEGVLYTGAVMTDYIKGVQVTVDTQTGAVTAENYGDIMFLPKKIRERLDGIAHCRFVEQALTRGVN